jgi:ribonuclease HI
MVRNQAPTTAYSPFFDTKGANACESPRALLQTGLSLSHLVALTLLKLRISLDLDAFSSAEFDDSFGFDGTIDSIDRPIGELAEDIFESSDADRVARLAIDIRKQYLDLCERINNANPYFWEGIATEELPSAPGPHEPRSLEEARLVLLHCRRAWDESEDALVMVEADTGRYIRPYEGPKTMENPVSLERRRGTGAAFPSKIEHAEATLLLEHVSVNNSSGRSVLGDRRKLLLYTDGACINNGYQDPHGGWAVWLGMRTLDGAANVVSGRLENQGPFGDHSIATSNRAELRAAIAALRLSGWKQEGFGTIVIATDSTYVLDGATAWTKGWVRNGWKLQSGHNVRNRDLWEMLLGEVERWKNQGVDVCVLNIPREHNADADAAAKEAARTIPDTVQFTDITLSSTQAPSTNNELQPYVLAICLAGESLFQDICGDFIKGMPAHARLTLVYNPESALDFLNGPLPPAMILIADAAIARHREVWERTIDHMRNGATVVAAGCFSSMATTGEFQRLFTIAGLPWRRGSYHRADTRLQPRIIDEHLTSCLPISLYEKFIFVADLKQSEAWYDDQDTPDQAAVAFTKVGSGRLGYIGSVNTDQSSVRIASAMFRLT